MRLPLGRVLGSVVGWLVRKVLPAAIEEIAEEVTDRNSARPPPLPDRYSEVPMPLTSRDVERQRALAKSAARAFPGPPRVPGQAPPPRKR